MTCETLRHKEKQKTAGKSVYMKKKEKKMLKTNDCKEKSVKRKL
jgi:hypothetical protein